MRRPDLFAADSPDASLAASEVRPALRPRLVLAPRRLQVRLRWEDLRQERPEYRAR